MSGHVGAERLVRRALEQARALEVPTIPDPDIVPPTRLEFARSTGIEPDVWQRDVLESDLRKILMLCSRQVGKSLTAGLLAGHEACFVPGSLTLMCAPSLKQSTELFRTTRGLIAQSTLPIPRILAESGLRLELENGSRIIALPGNDDTTRGFSAATLVIVDEGARVSDALIAAVRPTLATTGGRLVALSTPKGKRGWFFVEWATGERWHRSRVLAKDCPRITAEFLADEMRSLGPRLYAEEYECEFFDPDTAMFSSDLIERALVDLPPLWGTP
jgi:hypothetical protein